MAEFDGSDFSDELCPCVCHADGVVGECDCCLSCPECHAQVAREWFGLHLQGCLAGDPGLARLTK